LTVDFQLAKSNASAIKKLDATHPEGFFKNEYLSPTTAQPRRHRPQPNRIQHKLITLAKATPRNTADRSAFRTPKSSCHKRPKAFANPQLIPLTAYSSGFSG